MNNIIKSKTSLEIIEYNEKIVQKIADDWVNISAEVKKGESVFILYDVGGRQLAKEVGKLCAQKGCRVMYRVRELEMDSVLVENLSDKEIARYYASLNNDIMNADTVFLIRAAKNPMVMKDVDEKKLKLLNEAQKPIYLDYRITYTNWQLIYWPTQAEAKIEGMDLEEYAKLYFNSCNQDWKAIEKAQDILIDILNKGSELILIANPNDKDGRKRTYLSMSIEGMEFVNSTIKNNYPGSEVFSSPVKDSVNGQMFAEGKRMLGHEFKIVEDVYFKIKNGKIIEASAKSGEKALIAMLDRDKGARYFGEVAIGTNPGLRQRLFNPLLNEKVGGSFHITPGQAYKDEITGDKKIHIYNGNDSSIHWDITIQMLPNFGGGEIIVDGKTIQKDGKFLIDGLEPLNKGLG